MHPQTTVLSLDTGHERDYGEGAAYRDYFSTDDLWCAMPDLDDRLKKEFSDEELPGFPARLPDDDDAYDARLAADVSYDPRPFLDLIDTPMLYIFAENDLNVPTADSVAFLTAYRARYSKPIEVDVLANVGHSLFAWKHVRTAGYPPQYFQRMSDFAGRHTR